MVARGRDLVAGETRRPKTRDFRRSVLPAGTEDLLVRIDHHKGVKTLDRLFPKLAAIARELEDSTLTHEVRRRVVLV
jgi:hypothetical protein